MPVTPRRTRWRWPDLLRTGPLPVPALLLNMAGWVAALLVLAVGAYWLVWLGEKLYLVVLPFIAALLVTALVEPLNGWLRRHRLGRAGAAWLTILIGFTVLGGLLFFIARRVRSEYAALANQFIQVVQEVRDLLVNRLGFDENVVNQLENRLVELVQANTQTVISGVITGIEVIFQAVTAAILAFFIGFFLLYDGDRIWAWLTRVLPHTARHRAHESGKAAWKRISGYVRGTFLIACFHAIVVAITLVGLGTPLAAPLSLLVFLGSFIPIVGAIVFGGAAVLVTLLTQGFIGALVLVGVLVASNQVEAHLLQPFLVGRYVQLHPLAVVLAVTAGGLLQGIFGVILALPFTAAIYAVIKYLAASDNQENEHRQQHPSSPGETDAEPT